MWAFLDVGTHTHIPTLEMLCILILVKLVILKIIFKTLIILFLFQHPFSRNPSSLCHTLPSTRVSRRCHIPIWCHLGTLFTMTKRDDLTQGGSSIYSKNLGMDRGHFLFWSLHSKNVETSSSHNLPCRWEKHCLPKESALMHKKP